MKTTIMFECRLDNLRVTPTINTIEQLANSGNHVKAAMQVFKLTVDSSRDIATQSWEFISNLPQAVRKGEAGLVCWHLVRTLSLLANAATLPFACVYPRLVINTADFLKLRTKWNKPLPQNWKQTVNDLADHIKKTGQKAIDSSQTLLNRVKANPKLMLGIQVGVSAAALAAVGYALRQNNPNFLKQDTCQKISLFTKNNVCIKDDLSFSEGVFSNVLESTLNPNRTVVPLTSTSLGPTPWLGGLIGGGLTCFIGYLLCAKNSHSVDSTLTPENDELKEAQGHTSSTSNNAQLDNHVVQDKDLNGVSVNNNSKHNFNDISKFHASNDQNLEIKLDNTPPSSNVRPRLEVRKDLLNLSLEELEKKYNDNNTNKNFDNAKYLSIENLFKLSKNLSAEDWNNELKLMIERFEIGIAILHQNITTEVLSNLDSENLLLGLILGRHQEKAYKKLYSRNLRETSDKLGVPTLLLNILHSYYVIRRRAHPQEIDSALFITKGPTKDDELLSYLPYEGQMKDDYAKAVTLVNTPVEGDENRFYQKGTAENALRSTFNKFVKRFAPPLVNQNYITYLSIWMLLDKKIDGETAFIDRRVQISELVDKFLGEKDHLEALIKKGPQYDHQAVTQKIQGSKNNENNIDFYSFFPDSEDE
jgi:hypothetical protein